MLTSTKKKANTIYELLSSDMKDSRLISLDQKNYDSTNIGFTVVSMKDDSNRVAKKVKALAINDGYSFNRCHFIDKTKGNKKIAAIYSIAKKGLFEIVDPSNYNDNNFESNTKTK